MTKRIHSEQPQGHGGKRWRHVPPALTPVEVNAVRVARAEGVPYKVIARVFKVSRETLSRAVNRLGTYKDFK